MARWDRHRCSKRSRRQIRPLDDRTRSSIRGPSSSSARFGEVYVAFFSVWSLLMHLPLRSRSELWATGPGSLYQREHCCWCLPKWSMLLSNRTDCSNHVDYAACSLNCYVVICALVELRGLCGCRDRVREARTIVRSADAAMSRSQAALTYPKWWTHADRTADGPNGMSSKRESTNAFGLEASVLLSRSILELGALTR